MGASEKIRVAVLFGGRSAEHEVSLISGRTVIEALQRSGWDVVPIGITRSGGWLGPEKSRRLLEGGRLEEAGGPPALPPRTDCVFPALHGSFGEDGTVQGWLQVQDVPFVGSDCTGSSLAMDKSLTKRVLRNAGLPVISWSDVTDREFARDPDGVVARVLRERELPCFVKPGRLGSSVGISRVTSAQELRDGLAEAFDFGRYALVEPAWEARELEVAVLDGEPMVVTAPGEIRPSGWYDYRSKYQDDSAELLVPAPGLQPRMAEHFKELAEQAFRLLRLRGLARVDFFLGKKNGRPALNEVNTIPGFTPISMFSKLLEHAGVPFEDVCRRLVVLALDDHRRAQSVPAAPAGSLAAAPAPAIGG